jgi:hypothetical protein
MTTLGIYTDWVIYIYVCIYIYIKLETYGSLTKI